MCCPDFRLQALQMAEFGETIPPKSDHSGGNMTISKLLVANRGEIAIRIMRAASEAGIKTVAVAPEDDLTSLHTRKSDETVTLEGEGAPAYLDIEQIVALALAHECDAVHPGYGFLSENVAFADACIQAGIIFVGPDPSVLGLFGDKVAARDAAEKAGAPIVPGSSGATSLKEAEAFFAALGGKRPMIIKAVAGGGGRGVRVVEAADEIPKAYERSQSEAKAAFGDDAVYVEQLVERARHIEVQIAGDGTGHVIHFGERDCSIQRRHQKLVEIAPAPALPPKLRERISAAAVKIGESVNYSSLGTVEFLVDASDLSEKSKFSFIELNARLQVEHTVTEEVMGVDLVRLQLDLAAGQSLAALGFKKGFKPVARGTAIQLRVNMERLTKKGQVLPSGGVLKAFEPPFGPGVRIDTFGYAGYATNPRYDSLLAKVIVHKGTADFSAITASAYRALCEFRIEGVQTNIGLLQSLLSLEPFQKAEIYTRMIDDVIRDLAENTDAHRALHAETTIVADTKPAGVNDQRAGAVIDANDPLAVLSYGQSQAAPEKAEEPDMAPVAEGPEGAVPVRAALQGTIVSIDVSEGQDVSVGQVLGILESMKMEHEILADLSGTVRSIGVTVGDTIWEDHPLIFVEPGEVAAADSETGDDVDLDYIRPDLEEILTRQALMLDPARPEAIGKRHSRGHRSARENIYDLADDGSFVEYGATVLAAQRRRRSLEELIEKSPADGMITGVGTVNGEIFEDPISRVVMLSYDYTVFAGTQGGQNHRKTDRMIDVATDARMPLVIFAEGGGGRPGDTDNVGGGQRTFSRFATLSGLVPMVGITNARCFAGNASLLGCCDVVIATEGSNIGMGGPAMVEGGGLGIFTPEEIGPLDIQIASGVVDIAVEDEAAAVEVTKKYLSYFQGRLKDYETPDQRIMRRIIPENRLRVYKVRDVIETLADVGSVLEIRNGFGHAMVTSLIRVEGRPLGVVANNPAHLGGAIDSDGSDKAARFMQLCDAFDIPLLFLCDTPGIMVGPEVEKTALVRHSSRLFLTGANLSVPFLTIILRKAYGLGGIAMAGGSYKVPMATVSWPTGEFGGMGLEGSVKLGYRNELAAIEDPEERKQLYEEMVAAAYERGKAINQASSFGVDDAIDPADSRRWVAGLLKSVKPPPPREGKKRAFIDAW